MLNQNPHSNANTAYCTRHHRRSKSRRTGKKVYVAVNTKIKRFSFRFNLNHIDNMVLCNVFILLFYRSPRREFSLNMTYVYVPLVGFFNWKSHIQSSKICKRWNYLLVLGGKQILFVSSFVHDGNMKLKENHISNISWCVCHLVQYSQNSCFSSNKLFRQK